MEQPSVLPVVSYDIELMPFMLVVMMTLPATHQGALEYIRTTVLHHARVTRIRHFVSCYNGRDEIQQYKIMHSYNSWENRVWRISAL